MEMGLYKLELNKFEFIEYRVYYRGLKTITATVSDNGDGNVITYSNGDVIEVKDEYYVYLNDKLIANDPTITTIELEKLYKYILIKRGYKFL